MVREQDREFRQSPATCLEMPTPERCLVRGNNEIIDRQAELPGGEGPGRGNEWPKSSVHDGSERVILSWDDRMEVLLSPGDVFLTRGTGLLSKAIRFCTRSFGEKGSMVNHVGIVVAEGDIQSAMVVEALIKVTEHKLWKQYGPPRKDHVAVYRATNLSPQDIEIVVAEAREQVYKPYGFGKIIAHFLDWLLTGAYVFRHLTSNGDYPICSWLVAHSYAKIGKHFGVPPGAADPDDIWDFVDKRTEYYERIIELGPMSRFAAIPGHPRTRQVQSSRVGSPPIDRE